MFFCFLSLHLYRWDLSSFILPRGIGVTRGSVQEGGRGGQEVVSWVHGVASWHSWGALIPLEPSLPGVAKVVHAEPTARVAS